MRGERSERYGIMGFSIGKAQRSKSPLKMGIFGVSGSGKTYTALTLATGLGKKICVIDTEGGASQKYGDRFEFDVGTLDTYTTESYSAALNEIAKKGYDVCIIDSLSHAWDSKDGLIQEQEKLVAKGLTSMLAWAKVKTKNHGLMSQILGAQFHVICTFRSKDEYSAGDGSSPKTKLQRVGLGPVYEKNVQYEFDVFCQITDKKDLIVLKTRYAELDDMMVSRPGADFGAKLADTVATGVARPPPAAEDETVQDGPEGEAMAAITAAKDKPSLVALGPALNALKGKLSPEAMTRLSTAYAARGKEFAS